MNFALSVPLQHIYIPNPEEDDDPIDYQDEPDDTGWGEWPGRMWA